MAKKPNPFAGKKPGKSKLPAEVATPPRQKHFGALGDTMRRAHNTKRMAEVRKLKEC